jgi:iron complex outermembrane receptor protein
MLSTHSAGEPHHYHLCFLCWFLASLLASNSTQAGQGYDLSRLSLEELMNIEVTLVGRKPERWMQTAAAVSVITAADLRRWGVRSIPAALRAVPGLHIAVVDANKWVVTARGFAGLFANKLLVLIDGRSVYTPLFSGVFWEAQDVVLEDVERIEVIRGPGGTLWGANAVNGIINIVTKKAARTQGTLVQLGGGTKERLFATVRHGGQAGEHLHWRAYIKHFKRTRSPAATNRPVRDAWHAYHSGGRLDWSISDRDMLSLHANAYSGKTGQSVSLLTGLEPPYVQDTYGDADISGIAAQGRWERSYSEQAHFALQFYYDRAERRDIVLGGVIHNTDLDFQHRFRWTARQELTWGLGYRFTTDELDGISNISFIPSSRDTYLFSAFVHDEIAIIQQHLHLMLGAKLERNSYTDFETQPNARLWWSPTPRHLLWGAISRA